MNSMLDEAIQFHQQDCLQEACQAYAQYLKGNQNDAHAYYLYGAALIQVGEDSTAQEVLLKSVAINPNYPNAWCCLGRINLSEENLENAIKYYRNAIKLMPDYAEANLGLAQAHAANKDNKNALNHYRLAAQHYPDDPDIFLALVTILSELDLNKEALELFENTEELLLPNSEETSLRIAKLYFEVNKLEDAEKHYRQALSINHDNPDTHYRLGTIFYKQNKPQWAQNALETAIKLDPSRASNYLMAAKAAIKNSDHKSALEYIEIAVKENHDDYECLLQYGIILYTNKSYREGIIQLQKSILLNPENAETYSSLGNCFHKLNRFDAGIESFHKALVLDPDNPSHYLALSIIHLAARGKEKNENMNRALEYGLKAQKMMPENPSVHSHLGNVYILLGQSRLGFLSYKQALSMNPHNPAASSSLLFNINYLDDQTRENTYQMHKEWGETYAAKFLPQTLEYDLDLEPDKRLRIGYISPDFKIHSVAYFFAPMFLLHNPEEIETYIYYNNFDNRAEDEMTLKLKAKADHWDEVQKLNDEERAALIREHKIDILIELAGHSNGHCLFTNARKPAPIQVSWLGYPNTTGVAAIDYRFSDALIEPPCDDEISVEKIYRLPNGFNCYTPNCQFPEVAPAPVAKNGFISFGSYNNTCKINESVIKLWAQVLHAVPQSRIVLKDRFMVLDFTKNYIYTTFEKYGINKKRIHLLDFLSDNFHHLEQYGQMDIALDTFPYNGTTITCEALTMGVPIIALTGDRHVARVTSALVKRAGLDDWIAHTKEEYIAIAIKKSAALKGLIHLRSKQRSMVEASSIYNAPLITHDIENAYRDMWHTWLRNNSK